MQLSVFATFIAAPIVLVMASNVLEVNIHTFNDSIGDTPALVNFCSTWSMFCKDLAPTFEKLADAFSDQKSAVKIVKVDAGSDEEVRQKFGIQGYPTLKWFPKGVHSEPVYYMGGRKLEELTKFVTLQLDPSKSKEEKDVLVSSNAACDHCKNHKHTLDLFVGQKSEDEMAEQLESESLYL